MITRPARRSDLAEVLALYVAFDLATRGFVDSDESDVTGDWDAPGFDMATGTLVLERDGRVAGYAVVDADGVADTVTDLARPDDGAVDRLLDFLEAQPHPVLQHYLQVGDAEGEARFAQRGWAPARRFWRMRVELTAPTPAPVWPEGVQVRELDPARDGRAVHEVVQTAFEDVGDGHVRRPYDAWAARMLGDRFDPQLSLVAVEGDEVVGALLGQDVTDYAFVRQLAVPAASRGRGTALALLHEVFARARTRGLPAVGLGVDAANATGATRLYERAGMAVHEEFTRWDLDRR